MMTDRQYKQLTNLVIMYQRNFSIKGVFDQEIFDEVVKKIKRHLPFLDSEEKYLVTDEFAKKLAGELIHHNIVKDVERVINTVMYEVGSELQDIKHKEKR